VEENLSLFEDMRRGKYETNGATLRMKMDMLSPNPNMWDTIAYRIKYTPHPHIGFTSPSTFIFSEMCDFDFVGDGWCIYPTYDYTHCINDSLEDIDYSICTLEFENRFFSSLFSLNLISFIPLLSNSH